MCKRVSDGQSHALHTAAKEVRSMKDTAGAVRTGRAADIAPVDVAVSTDSTWMRCVQSVIYYDTKQVLDIDA